jgi:hypothetical protein
MALKRAWKDGLMIDGSEESWGEIARKSDAESKGQTEYKLIGAQPGSVDVNPPSGSRVEERQERGCTNGIREHVHTWDGVGR